MLGQLAFSDEAQTPYFLRIPEEFVQFLQSEYELQTDDYPFLLELAHYEWVELALSVSDEVNDTTRIDAQGSLLDGIPVHSKLTWSFAYQFPVHRISADFLPDTPGSQTSYLTVCRKANDDMGFMEMNPVAARLLELIVSNDSASGRQLLKQFAQEMKYTNPGELVAHGLEAMEEMRAAEIILGVK